MLKWLAYYLSLPFLLLLSFLPFWILYRLSDLAYVILFHIVGYRRKVVETNLRNAFPDRPERELRVVERRFYRHFCDLFVETAKAISIRPRTLQRRVALDPGNHLARLQERNQSALMALGHYGNWELGGLRASMQYPDIMYSIYRPLKNPGFDRMIRRTRGRFGMGLYPMKSTLRGMLANRNKTTFTFFLTDQAPPPENAIWVTFLNQDTPVFAGIEKIARKFGYPVVFVSSRKVARGHYQIIFEPLVEDPGALPPGELTALHIRRLEKEILQAPEFWLWSHRRWKHKRPPEQPIS